MVPINTSNKNKLFSVHPCLRLPPTDLEQVLQDMVLQAIISTCTLHKLYSVLDLPSIEVRSLSSAESKLKTVL